MVIGVSGKIGAGKDLTGRIIQYLITISKYEEFKDNTFEQFIETVNDFEAVKQDRGFELSNWQIKKYAYKLKQIVALLTGCTVEDLENQEFKNKEIGESWIKWEIAWSDFADTLKLNQNYWTKAVANSEQEAKNIAGLSGAFTIRYCREVRLTYRTLLQLVGTEAMRNCIHENVWVNALFSDYSIIGGKMIPPKEGEEYTSKNHIYPNWIITDTRFPNEAKAIKDRDGIVIRVNRSHDLDVIMDEHPSETALDDYEFDYVIDNNGTIEELIEKVREVLRKEKLI